MINYKHINSAILLLLMAFFLIMTSGTANAQIMPSEPQVTGFELEKYLVNVKKLDPTTFVELKYATKYNVFGTKFYNKNIAYLRPEVAKRLVKVHKHLNKSGFGIKIWDAYRPYRVQKQMWALKPDERYVANPSTGSVFNRGAAVAVTLVDKEGNPQEMPTDFDNFTEKAHHSYKGGSWTAHHNRRILKRAMEKFGFYPVESEWWHYNDIDAGKYKILDIPF